jgi:hypothetical protein
VGELDMEVTSALDAFMAWPSLIRTYKEEFDIISNYYAMKALFLQS